MKYTYLTQQQQNQELQGRITALERRHYLRNLDLAEAQAVADICEGEDQKQAMTNVGSIMQDLESIELSLQALNAK